MSLETGSGLFHVHNKRYNLSWKGQTHKTKVCILPLINLLKGNRQIIYV